MSFFDKMKAKVGLKPSQTKARVVSQRDIREFDADPFRFYDEHKGNAESFSFETDELKALVNHFGSISTNKDKQNFFKDPKKLRPELKIALFFKAKEICEKGSKTSCEDYVKNIFIPLDIIKISKSGKSDDGKAEVILGRYYSKLPDFNDLINIFMETRILFNFYSSANKYVFYKNAGPYLKRAIILNAISEINNKIKNPSTDISEISSFIEKPDIKNEILKEAKVFDRKNISSVKIPMTSRGTEIYENVKNYYSRFDVTEITNANKKPQKISNKSNPFSVLTDVKYYDCQNSTSYIPAIFYGLIMTILNSDDKSYSNECVDKLIIFFNTVKVAGKIYGESNYENKQHIIDFFNDMKTSRVDLLSYNAISKYINFIFTEKLKDKNKDEDKIYAMSKLLGCSGCDIEKYNAITDSFNEDLKNSGQDFYLPRLKAIFYKRKYYGVSYKLSKAESNAVKSACTTAPAVAITSFGTSSSSSGSSSGSSITSRFGTRDPDPLVEAQKFENDVNKLNNDVNDFIKSITNKEGLTGFNPSNKKYTNMFTDIDVYLNSATSYNIIATERLAKTGAEITKLTPASGSISASNKSKIDKLGQVETIYNDCYNTLTAIIAAINNSKLRQIKPSSSSSSSTASSTSSSTSSSTASTLGLNNNAIKYKDNFLSQIDTDYKSIETELAKIPGQIAAANTLTNNSAKASAKNGINQKKQDLVKTLNDMNKAIDIEMVAVGEEITRLNGLIPNATMTTNMIKTKIARLQAIIATAKDYQTKIQALIDANP